MEKKRERSGKIIASFSTQSVNSEKLECPKPTNEATWIFHGNNPGLKAKHLIDFISELDGMDPIASFPDNKKPSDLISVLPGICIGSEYFKKTESGYINAIPPKINEEIVASLPKGKPIAVRSSATNEQGGTGTYHTEFIILDNEKDSKDNLNLLVMAENKVYDSYFSDQAQAYRDEVADTNGGMGILIQPCIGDGYNYSFFTPALSGVFTIVNNEPLLRLVVGLGTSAVNTTNAITLTGDKIRELSFLHNDEQISKLFDDYSYADVINIPSWKHNKNAN